MYEHKARSSHFEATINNDKENQFFVSEDFEVVVAQIFDWLMSVDCHFHETVCVDSRSKVRVVTAKPTLSELLRPIAVNDHITHIHN